MRELRAWNVAVAGCGAITAAGNGIGSLREALQKNASGLRAQEKFNSPRFQSCIVGAAPRSFDDENPAWLLADTALKEARQAAAGALKDVPASRIGLVLSTTKANIEALERISANRSCSETARRHLLASFLAKDLAAAHGALGPVQAVSVACVSGLMAIQQGVGMIQRNEADAVYIVGVDCLSEFVMAGFTALKALDPVGCRPFDADRRGLSPGEAGAAIVLTRGDMVPESAITIRAFGDSNDANHLTGPSRDGAGLVRAIKAALASAELSPDQIDYVHAHGTATNYNDAMESLALQTVFGAACPPVSGSKGMLGHTLGAAGVIETICCVLAMQANFLPGTPRLGVAAEGAPVSLVREPRPVARLKNVLKLNTGFGGMNGALIIGHE